MPRNWTARDDGQVSIVSRSVVEENPGFIWNKCLGQSMSMRIIWEQDENEYEKKGWMQTDEMGNIKMSFLGKRAVIGRKM